MPEIGLSLGSSFPACDPFAAMELAGSVSDPVIGNIGIGSVQICPQNAPVKIAELVIDELAALYPETSFRLHANVRLLDRPCLFDLGSIERHPEYRSVLVRMLSFLSAPYSIHAGVGKHAPSALEQIGRCLALEEEAGVPVAIEGLYPGAGPAFASWEDYELFLRHDVCFAIDLSHLNILRHKTGFVPDGLVEALVSHSNCIEVHLSGNNGTRDSHERVNEGAWWLSVLGCVNPSATIFYEGRQKSPETT